MNTKSNHGVSYLKLVMSIIMSAALVVSFSFPTQAIALQSAGSLSKIQEYTGTPDRSSVKNAIIEALNNWDGSSTIEVECDATGLAPKSIGQIITNMQLENGEFFFIGKDNNYSYNTNKDGTIDGDVTLMINTDSRFSKNDVTLFNNKVNEVLNGVNPSWSDEEKALYLHDYIVTHCQYGELSSDGGAADDRVYTTYGALIDGVAVCQGYSELYAYLLKNVGIESHVVSSEAINHSWNVLFFNNGETYYVDCTWDDPTGNGAWSEVYCGHDNFLRTESEMRLTETPHNTNDWVVSVCGETSNVNGKYGNSNRYSNAYWRNTMTAIPQVGRLAAYVDNSVPAQNSNIYIHNYGTGANVTGNNDNKIASLPSQWTSLDGNSIWSGNYISLTTDGVRFYASTPSSIYSITTNGNSSVARTLSTAEQAIGQIYGVFYDKNKKDCVYWLKSGPNDIVKTQGYSSEPAKSVDINNSIKVDVSNNQIEYDEDISPDVVASYLGYTLKQGVDYRIEYLDQNNNVVSKPVNAGVYTIRLIGLGSFSGTINAGKFTINKTDNDLWVNSNKVNKTFKRSKLKKTKTFALPKLCADYGQKNAKWKISKANKKTKKVLKLKGNKIQVKKKAKKGTYTIKLQASVPGSNNYYGVSKLKKPVTVKVKVK